MSVLKRLLTDTEGADAAEYALVIGLVALAIILGAIFLGGMLNNSLSQEGNCIQTEIATKAKC
jgi:pilus assembly protein Flp/PilA